MDAKALLDSLMGPSRDKPLAEQKKGDGFKEKNVCKYYMVGFCPTNINDNWFHNTKRDLGKCTKVHSDRLKEDYENHPDRSKYQQLYETEFLKYLEGLVDDAEGWIKRETLHSTQAGRDKVTKLPDAQKAIVVRMQDEADTAMKKAEEMAEKGQVTASKAMSTQSAKLIEEINSIREQHSFFPKGDLVCDVCGIRCNLDEDNAYEAHMNSNLHTAYKKIRQAATDLKEKLEKTPKVDTSSLDAQPAERSEARSGIRGNDHWNKVRESARGNDRSDRSNRERERERSPRRDRDRRREKDADRDPTKLSREQERFLDSVDRDRRRRS